MQTRLGLRQHDQCQPGAIWVSFFLPRCSQDPAGGQLLSALFTNRKESIPLQFSEDCLYLNIYTPADLTKSTRLPVSPCITGPNLWIPALVTSVHWKGDRESCRQEYYRQELSRKSSDVRPWLRLPCLWDAHLNLPSSLTLKVMRPVIMTSRNYSGENLIPTVGIG